MAAGLVFIISKKRLKYHLGQGLFLLLIALALFALGGEEISWGQRLLGFQTPQAIKEINTQDEFTFHNSAGFREYVGQAYFIIGIFGSIAWIIRRFLKKHLSQLVAQFKVFLDYSLPYWYIAPYFFSIFAYNWYQSNFDYKINQFSEYSEFILAMGIFIWMFVNYSHYRSLSNATD